MFEEYSYLVQGVCKILISHLKRLRFYEFKSKNKVKKLKLSLFRLILTKKSVMEHQIVLMLDMKLFSKFWCSFYALENVFIQLLSLSVAPESQTTNLGTFFVSHMYKFSLNFDRKVLETFEGCKITATSTFI